MRKMLCLLLGFAALGVQARERTESEMLAIAQQQLQQTDAARRAAGQLSAVNVERVLQADMLSLYNAETGFVVVSRDDAFDAVLGYADQPVDMDSAAPGFLWWLNAIEQSMAQRRASGQVKKVQAPAVAEKFFFITSQWGQQDPFNSLCPKETSGKISLTGCVATALAQILNYYEYPVKSQGVGSYYLITGQDQISGENILSDVFTENLNTTYNWSIMLDKYKKFGGATAAQKTAVAELMRDCGFASKMQYSSQASATLLDDATEGIVRNFGFPSQSIRYGLRDYYSDDEWMNIIYTELMARRPILYTGVDYSSGGHAFVFDGLDETGKIHVNWGWNGTSDGFFDFADLAPTGIQGSTGTDHFNSAQDMMYGITPTEDLSSLWPMTYSEFASYEGSYTLSSTSKNIIYARTSTGRILNIHYMDFYGKIGLCLKNVDTGTDYFYAINYDTSKGVGFYMGAGLRSTSFTIQSAVPAGTYYAFLASKANEDSEYRPVRCIGGAVRYTVQRAADGTMTFSDQETISGIEPVAKVSTAEQSRYNLRGQRVDGRQKGINIVRMSDGTTRKVLVR